MMPNTLPRDPNGDSEKHMTKTHLKQTPEVNSP